MNSFSSSGFNTLAWKYRYHYPLTENPRQQEIKTEQDLTLNVELLDFAINAGTSTAS